jgi:hypothetical protein
VLSRSRGDDGICFGILGLRRATLARRSTTARARWASRERVGPRRSSRERVGSRRSSRERVGSRRSSRERVGSRRSSRERVGSRRSSPFARRGAPLADLSRGARLRRRSLRKGELREESRCGGGVQSRGERWVERPFGWRVGGARNFLGFPRACAGPRASLNCPPSALGGSTWTRPPRVLFFVHRRVTHVSPHRFFSRIS